VVAIRWMKVVATSRLPPGPAQGPGVLANPALMSGSTGRREQRPSLVNARPRHELQACPTLSQLSQLQAMTTRLLLR
jgi:hypothetical protein